MSLYERGVKWKEKIDSRVRYAAAPPQARGSSFGRIRFAHLLLEKKVHSRTFCLVSAASAARGALTFVP
jgi:hypothetical protein